MTACKWAGSGRLQSEADLPLEDILAQLVPESGPVTVLDGGDEKLDEVVDIVDLDAHAGRPRCAW